MAGCERRQVKPRGASGHWRRRALALGVGAAWTLTGCARTPAPVAPNDALLSARLRRLSNVEYERSVNALLDLEEPVRDLLPPDERQDGYTINEREAVPSYVARELERLAERLAALAVARNRKYLLPCPATDSPTSSCIARALAKLELRAFRRPPTASEERAVQGLFARAASAPTPAGDGESSAHARGLEQVLRTLLAAPSLLYLSELGRSEGTPGSVLTLNPDEIASSLAYAVTGAPPDQELRQAAAAPEHLLTQAAREAQARRLLSLTTTRQHFREFVLEWLEVDQLERTAKAANLVPDYDSLKRHMLVETEAFVDEVMVYGGASLTSLLGAGFTSLDADMATYYGIPGFQGARVSLVRQGRVGLLEQASFLSAHAYEDVTSPVKRGDFVLRRVLCVDLPRPGELGIDITMPPRDESATTRARFSAHTSAAMCRSCHASIDPIGFSFESFDAAGRRRTREYEQPITTAGEVTLAGRTFHFRDSAELMPALAETPEARRCFASQALRYLTGRRSAPAEQWFGELIDRLPKARQDSLLEWVVTWVSSPEFIQRRRGA